MKEWFLIKTDVLVQNTYKKNIEELLYRKYEKPKVL